jgi:hypothetical protein
VLLLGLQREQDAAAAAVVIQAKRTHHIVVGKVLNDEVAIEDLLENSDVEN